MTNALRIRIAMGLVAVAVGIFTILVGLGVVKFDSTTAPHWVIAVSGLAFIFAGFAVMMGSDDGRGGIAHVLRSACGLVVIAAIASVASWVAFGPGPREFTSGGGVGGIEVSGSADPSVGRIVFGISAVLAWAAFLLLLFQAVVRRPPAK